MPKRVNVCNQKYFSQYGTIVRQLLLDMIALSRQQTPMSGGK